MKTKNNKQVRIISICLLLAFVSAPALAKSEKNMKSKKSAKVSAKTLIAQNATAQNATAQNATAQN
ncbi:MAG: hypothetical protein HN900_09080, partial [Gammaproteobacteria bacterium]|nr:hypothetical protein [Gammaproteobacteria bacterium]MBT7174816.1 hypothetical protein [Gammaproteobacteria bacterium]